MTAVSDLADGIERAEESYEFLISYAGKGLDRHEADGQGGEVHQSVEQLDAALADVLSAARRIPEEYDLEWGEELDAVLDGMEPEVDEARTVLALLAAQDRITSAQVDNMNGMSVFQSVIMKLFFLDEVTAHLDWENDPVRGVDDGG